jgi:predicted MFS family arabinose efflux permease
MQLLKRHDFAMIWLAGLLAYIGNGMFFIALPIWVYQEYGSATLVGTAALMAIIPSVVLGSVAGIFVDRWDRTRVMLVVTLLRVALFLVLAFAAQVEWFWLILAVRFTTTSVMRFFSPAEQSLLPKLVESEAELVQVNSLNQLNNNLGGIIGNGLGGVMLLWVGLEGIALVMAALTAVGALLLSRIRYQDRRAVVAQGTEAKSFSLSRSARNGMTLFTRNPSIRVLLLIISVASVTNVGYITLLPVFALETLEVNEAGVGLILMAGSVGGLIGAVLLGFVPSTLPPHRILQGSILVGAVLEVIFYGYPLFTGGILVVSMAIEFVGGFPNAGANATLMTVFQTRVPEHLLGRAFGSLGSIQAAVMLIATPIAGVLADIFSAQAVLLVITLFVFASWVISLRLSDEAPGAQS